MSQLGRIKYGSFKNVILSYLITEILDSSAAEKYFSS
jgi:hypothetical protein